MSSKFSFTRKSLQSSDQSVDYYSLPALVENGMADVSRLPLSIRVLLESVLRNQDHAAVEDSHIDALMNWGKPGNTAKYHLSRVVWCCRISPVCPV